MSPPKSLYGEQLDRIENAILGNGREGLLGRTARIEERLNTVSDLAEETKKTAENAIDKSGKEILEIRNIIGALALNLTKMESALTTHVGTDHLSVLMKKKGFWALIVIGFITLHIVATYIPSLWDAIMMLVGLPKLVIPIR